MLGSPRRWGLLNSRDSLVCTVRSTVRALKATVKVYETSGASPAVSNIGLVTLTTQCSLDRWPKFQQQAESWGGPVSVAVYIPAPQHTPAADAAVSVLQNWAADHADHHPHQQLQVVALFAGHYARKGASVLVEQGPWSYTPTMQTLLCNAGLHTTNSSEPSPAAGPTAPSPAAGPTAPSTSPSIPYDQLYPINALRNAALQHASTPLVLPVDADFILSQGLHQQLHVPCPGYSILDTATAAAACGSFKAAGAAQLAVAEAQAWPTGATAAAAAVANDAVSLAAAAADVENQSLVQQLLLNQQLQPNIPVTLVLPAFQLVPQQRQSLQPSLSRPVTNAESPTGELSTGQQGDSSCCVPDSQALTVPRTKAELLAALGKGSVVPFDCGVFAPKQQPLDVPTWCTAQEPVQLQYVDLFEVHGGISVKQQMPPYSEAFRGYGLNKQQHAWHAAALGFTFKVLPEAFMVTAPHKRSTSWRPTPGTAADAAHLERISTVYAQFKQQLAEQGLVPQTQQ